MTQTHALERLLRRGAIALAGCVAFPAFAHATDALSPPLVWLNQFGAEVSEQAWAVDADGLGSVYLAGRAVGPFVGPHAGKIDGYLTKMNDAGAIQWSKQFGSDENDEVYGVSSDGLGGVYVAGRTTSNLSGAGAFGLYDAFLTKYDDSGALLWSRQFGTRTQDSAFGVSADSLGNIYIAGSTDGNLGGVNPGNEDAFLAKFDTAGNRVWTRQFGTMSSDFAQGVSADGLGNVYVTGTTNGGSLAGPYLGGGGDAFLAKYDSAGSLLWSRQFGTAETDTSYTVSADGLGNSYVAGWTAGSLAAPHAGNRDPFVSKYDAAGNVLWTRQIGTASYDEYLGVAADQSGNVFLTGYTEGSIANSQAGLGDLFVTKLDASGTQTWIRQFGTARPDETHAIAADGLGNAYISGFTDGALGGPHLGAWDSFAARFSAVPEPSAAALASLAAIAISRQHRSSRSRTEKVC